MEINQIVCENRNDTVCGEKVWSIYIDGDCHCDTYDAFFNRKLETHMQQLMKVNVFEKEKINLAWHDVHVILKII